MLPKGLEELFLEAIRAGMTIASAQKLVGVSRSWHSERCKRYPDWEAKVNSYEMQGLRPVVQHLSSEATKDWRASVEFLKRRYKEDYGDTQVVTVTAKDTDPLEGYTDDEILKLKEIERAKDERKQSEGKV